MKHKSKLMKLKHLQKRTRFEVRYSSEYKGGSLERKERGKKEWKRIPIVKNFHCSKQTQNWNPDFPHELDMRETPRYLVPKHVFEFCEYLKDLFCVTDKILLDLRYDKKNHTGSCYYEVSKDGYVKILVGARGGLRATTLIHEFLHSAGLEHEYDLNDTHDFRSNCVLDNYSPLVCRDIFGKNEVFLT